MLSWHSLAIFLALATDFCIFTSFWAILMTNFLPESLRNPLIQNILRKFWTKNNFFTQPFNKSNEMPIATGIRLPLPSEFLTPPPHIPFAHIPLNFQLLLCVHKKVVFLSSYLCVFPLNRFREENGNKSKNKNKMKNSWKSFFRVEWEEILAVKQSK